jgi:hypothetical protein
VNIAGVSLIFGSLLPRQTIRFIDCFIGKHFGFIMLFFFEVTARFVFAK